MLPVKSQRHRAVEIKVNQETDATGTTATQGTVLTCRNGPAVNKYKEGKNEIFKYAPDPGVVFTDGGGSDCFRLVRAGGKRR